MSDRLGVLLAAVEGFHQQFPEHGEPFPPRHNSAFTDSPALTHCICFGAAGRTLDYLLDHPDEYEALRAARGSHCECFTCPTCPHPSVSYCNACEPHRGGSADVHHHDGRCCDDSLYFGTALNIGCPEQIKTPHNTRGDR